TMLHVTLPCCSAYSHIPLVFFFHHPATTELYTLSLHDALPISQLTFFPDPVSGASYQPTDGRYIVFTKDVGGAEFFQKYRYDVATGEITLLTDGKSRNVGGAWSHKGDRYAYMSTRRTGRDLDLWVVDPSNAATDRMVLQLQGGGYGPLDWSPDDRTILLSQGVSVNEGYLWLVDAASGQKTLLAPQPGSEPVAYGDAKF